MIEAATMKKAAEEKSAGTTMRRGVEALGGRDDDGVAVA